MTTSTNPASRSSRTREKVEHPAKAYTDPAEVVADPTLTAREKREVLNSLEQDARQLAVASAEGMTGGEETKLRPVLRAQDSLPPPSVDAAFSMVRRTFDDQLRKTIGTETHAIISRAMEAMEAAQEAIAARASAPTPPPGVPEPGSAEEVQEELDKEKLDPGA